MTHCISSCLKNCCSGCVLTMSCWMNSFKLVSWKNWFQGLYNHNTSQNNKWTVGALTWYIKQVYMHITLTLCTSCLHLLLHPVIMDCGRLNLKSFQHCYEGQINATEKEITSLVLCINWSTISPSFSYLHNALVTLLIDQPIVIDPLVKHPRITVWEREREREREREGEREVRSNISLRVTCTSKSLEFQLLFPQTLQHNQLTLQHTDLMLERCSSPESANCFNWNGQNNK